MSDIQSNDEELREKILIDWLVHDEECTYSKTGMGICDCIQAKVINNIMPLIKAYGYSERLEMVNNLDDELVKTIQHTSPLALHNYLLSLKAELQSAIKEL